MTSLLQTTPIMSNNNTSNNNNTAIYRRIRGDKKSLKKKQRIARPERPRPVRTDLPVSPPETRNIEGPKKKMRTKENLFNHVDDDINALLDAQEAKRSEYSENQEYMYQVYSKISVIFQDHEYVKFQVNNEALNALDGSNVKVYERLSCPELDTRMTLPEYEAHLLKEESYWNLWKSHGLSRKQYEDHQTYEQNCETLMNLATDDPEYEVLRIKIQAFEDEMDARVKEEEAKMNEWFLDFERNNSVFMSRILE